MDFWNVTRKERAEVADLARSLIADAAELELRAVFLFAAMLDPSESATADDVKARAERLELLAERILAFAVEARRLTARF